MYGSARLSNIPNPVARILALISCECRDEMSDRFGIRRHQSLELTDSG